MGHLDRATVQLGGGLSPLHLTLTLTHFLDRGGGVLPLLTSYGTLGGGWPAPFPPASSWAADHTVYTVWDIIAGKILSPTLPGPSRTQACTKAAWALGGSDRCTSPSSLGQCAKSGWRHLWLPSLYRNPGHRQGKKTLEAPLKLFELKFFFESQRWPLQSFQK